MYRSNRSSSDEALILHLQEMVRGDRICIICGDFNIRLQNEPEHVLVTGILKMDFVQLIDKPTHKDGGIIDHFYLYRPSLYSEVSISWDLFSPFYSDHFGISIIIKKEENAF